MTVTANISASVSGSQVSALDLGTITYPFSTSASTAFTAGTGAGAIDRVYADERTLAASGTEDIDLATYTDVFGAAVSMARIKAVYIKADAANTNNVQVTRPASNGIPWLMAAGDGIALRPGAWQMWGSGSADATGVVVTAATGDLITITNSAGTTGVTYKIVILGCSA
jgi:hypothetical protein